MNLKIHLVGASYKLGDVDLNLLTYIARDWTIKIQFHDFEVGPLLLHFFFS
jgi:hypothetical protein